MEFRVVRHTDRFDAVCAFYGTVLGWPVTHEWPAGDGQGRGRLFGAGSEARLEFIELVDGTSPAPLTGAFVSVEVDDAVALHAHIAATGHHVAEPLHETPWGHVSFAVDDPAGVRLVLWQHR